MKARRGKDKLRDLCSGPGKLAMALGITGAHHGTPLAGRGRPAGVGLRRPAGDIIHSVAPDIRVGISKAVEHPWRFLVPGHAHVSVPLGKVKIPG
ncbi:MAG: DNA-3-methyladenine glycosylase, partial [Verrucomicrobiaceae bacterium]